MTFPNDQARREYFLEKLQDKKFRKMEGFPIGDDEDILAMSDPPYYTACPNPFLGERSVNLAARCEREKPSPQASTPGRSTP